MPSFLVMLLMRTMGVLPIFSRIEFMIFGLASLSARTAQRFQNTVIAPESYSCGWACGSLSLVPAGFHVHLAGPECWQIKQQAIENVEVDGTQ